MRVCEQVLAPGVENAEDADFRAEVLGSAAISIRVAALAVNKR
jgi:hypothetical protein